MTDFAAIMKAIGRPISKLIPALAVEMTKQLPKAGITTPLRIAHFLGQANVETMGFLRLKEMGSPEYFHEHYDPPTRSAHSLGNIHQGDGAKYCGRGVLQETGRWNYGYLGKLAGLDLIDHPELLEQPATGLQAALSFWAHHGLNDAADHDNATLITRIINGPGLNALAQRISGKAKALAMLTPRKDA